MVSRGYILRETIRALIAEDPDVAQRVKAALWRDSFTNPDEAEREKSARLAAAIEVYSRQDVAA
jgi:hypothetical protein